MTRPLPLAAVLALPALLALPAHADPARPALPPGWVAGGPPSPVEAPPPPAPRSRAALQLGGSPLRHPLAAVPLSLADLDTVDLEPAPTWDKVLASNAEPRGNPPTDLFVAPGCVRVSVSGHRVGSVTLGTTQAIGPWSDGGVPYGHGADADGKHLYDRLEWETLDRLPDGTLRFTETVARVHVQTCKATVARRFTVVARPILDGRAYAFRARCAACAPEARDELHVITPGGWGSVPYERHVVQLAAFGASGFRTRVETTRIRRFTEVTGRPLADPKEGTDAVIGVEETEALGERAPTLIAYTFDDPKREWGF